MERTGTGWVSAQLCWCLGLLATVQAASATGVCGTPQTISCGQTIQGQLDSNSCFALGSYLDTFTFSGLRGQIVGAAVTSSAFAPASYIVDPAGNTESFTTTTEVDPLAPVIAVVPGLDVSSGSWKTQVAGSNTGPYSLTLLCYDASSVCIGDRNTLCLNNGRFQVQATFDAGGGNAGLAHTLPMSDGTGALYFFDPTNAEVLIKILDGCGFSGHYWVFAGGLTNVKVVITVTDTQTGAVRNYTNPPNTTFQPIQDTSAFATCP